MSFFFILQLILLSIVLIGGAYAVATIVIPARRNQLVASMANSLSATDTRYFAASLESLAEILVRIILPLLPLTIIGAIFLSLAFEGFSLFFIVITIVKSLLIIVPLLIAVAYLTLLERKVMASMQRRKGPNVVGMFGLLQPLADGLKLFLKETLIPSSAHKVLFVLAPIMTFFLAVCGWAVIPFDQGMVFSDINVGILYLFAVSSLGVYGVILSGWSSNTKYSFLGALRSSAQMISYEIGMGFVLLIVFIMVGSLNVSNIVLAQKDCWFALPLFPAVMIWFVCILAETNRAPFDLPEAEAELVAGYFTEYSAMGFALFFLGEYSNMILMSTITSLCYFGGWFSPFPGLTGIYLLPGYLWLGIKVTLILFGFVWVRAAFPRYRFDQLLYLGWKCFLPFLLGYFIFVAGVLFAFDWLPA